MARQLRHLVEAPRPCSYLPDARASLESRVLLDVTLEELEILLERGWRRFGPLYFRPACVPCMECVPIRIPVALFSPSRSQRRAQAACASLRQEMDIPRVDDARLDLLARWHAMREETRGWGPSPQDEESYSLEFGYPHPAARELTFWDRDKLVGVALCDETAHALSAIYFFYDPDYRDRSLGTANVLAQIAHAKHHSLAHLYLGFRVLGCPSMRYKASFRPHELLVGRPAMNEPPEWQLRASS